jgi:riboflavin synthase
MFTGIITDVGRVKSIRRGGDTRLDIETRYDTAGVDMGASIACSGACLTVIDKGPGWFGVAASAETLARTTLGTWQAGTGINLERALKVGDELGGHIVSGHVDGVGRLEAIRPEGDSLRLTFSLPEPLRLLVAEKGSITVDGVSLTVNEVSSDRFGVNIIEHTRKVTTLGERKVGDPVNLEIDMLARYVARLLGKDRP